MRLLTDSFCPVSRGSDHALAAKHLWSGPPVPLAPPPCRSRALVRAVALAYPRTQRLSSAAPDASRQVWPEHFMVTDERSVTPSTSESAAPVTYLGPEEDVAGHRLFMHLRHDCTMGQVVALCNRLVGRVPCGGKQAMHAHLRPISLSTPAGRFDWDPVGEELPGHMWTLLGASAHELKLKMLTASLSSDTDLATLRQTVTGIVDYIQHGEHDSGLSASF